MTFTSTQAQGNTAVVPIRFRRSLTEGLQVQVQMKCGAGEHLRSEGIVLQINYHDFFCKVAVLLEDVHRLLRRRLNLPPSELPQGQIDELFRLLNAMPQDF